MSRPTQPDMNDPVWTDTPLSIQQWMDDAAAYITAIEQERDEALRLLHEVASNVCLASDSEEPDYCFSCGGPANYVKGDIAHRKNCPWVEARQFLAHIEGGHSG